MMYKELPYFDILMYCPKETLKNFTEPELRPGLFFEQYNAQSGRERWAQIEQSAGEFDTTEDAKKKFDADFDREESFLSSRIFFLVENGQAVANACIWETEMDGALMPMLHWVAVREEKQGLGYGEMVVRKTLYELKRLYPGKAAVLHTQTWSWPAVNLYMKMGFKLLKSDKFGHYVNRYREAMETLKCAAPKELYRKMLENSI